MNQTHTCLRLLQRRGRTMSHRLPSGQQLRRPFSSSTRVARTDAGIGIQNQHDGIDENHPALHGSLTPTAPVARIRNFSPGPTSLPDAVEAEIRKSCFPHPTGGGNTSTINNFRRLSSIALSHRSPEFGDILAGALETTRAVLEIPDEYEVLFLHGGGHGQFAAVPLNLCPTGKETATYVVNGTWSERAVGEASKYCRPVEIHGPRSGNGSYIGFPDLHKVDIDPSSKFIYVCSNETVGGLELHRLPQLRNGIPLVVDATWDVTSKPIDWRGSNVGILFACASKNIGHPGVTLVVARKDLLDGANLDVCPGVLHYKTNAEAENVWNTTPTFNVDVLRLVMEWILREGGIHAMEHLAIRKANKVYQAIDDSMNGFYSTPLGAESKIRSRMNIPFDVAGGDEALTNRFLVESFDKGLVGFRTKTPFGNGRYLRTSLYHGVSEEDVDHLVDFMAGFAERHDPAAEYELHLW